MSKTKPRALLEQRKFRCLMRCPSHQSLDLCLQDSQEEMCTHPKGRFSMVPYRLTNRDVPCCRLGWINDAAKASDGRGAGGGMVNAAAPPQKTCLQSSVSESMIRATPRHFSGKLLEEKNYRPGNLEVIGSGAGPRLGALHRCRTVRG